MIVSEKGLQFIRLHEGVHKKAYRDPVGILTIGVGFTMRSSAFKEWWRKWKGGELTIHSTMTDEEINDALAFLIWKEYGKAVEDFLGNKQVPQHVFDAMVSAVFNLGPGALKWRWAQAVKSGDYVNAALYLAKTGTTAKGKVLRGLVRRRKEEADLLRYGIYTGVKAAPKVTKPATVPATPKPPVAPLPETPKETKSHWLVAVFKALAAMFRRSK
jgi:lysozyme